MRRRSSVRTLLVAALLASIAPIANSLPPLSRADAAAGNITGTVYNDKNSDGVNNNSDSAVGGVEVKGYDSTGALVGTTTTAVNGTYTLAVSGTATNDIRVEFTTPTGYQPSFAGTGNATSIQFTTIGASNVSYAIEQPGAYCENNNADPKIGSICINPGESANTNTTQLASLAYSQWTNPSTKINLTTHGQTGATWGLASDPGTGLVWQSAVVRRHAGLGPKGIAGLYVSHPATGGIVASFDLTAAPYGLTFKDPASDYSNAARGISTVLTGNPALISLDVVAFNNVGKEGIGDIDISADGRYLWVTNLYQKKIHRIELVGTVSSPGLGAVTTYELPQAGSNGCATVGSVARPWGLYLDKSSGAPLVGVVCTNEAASPIYSQNAPAHIYCYRGSASWAGSNCTQKFTSVPESAKILGLDLSGAGTWSTKATLTLSYPRETEFCNNIDDPSAADLTKPIQWYMTASGDVFRTSTRCENAKWHSWINLAGFQTLRASFDPTQIEDVDLSVIAGLGEYPQPMLSDIEVLADGSIVVAIADRYNYQMGSRNIAPDEPDQIAPLTFPLIGANVSGEMLLLCKSGASTWTQENDGQCIGASTTYSSRSTSRTAGITGGLRLEVGYREFFDDNFDRNNNSNNDSGTHTEMSAGALAVWPPSGSVLNQRVASSAMDAANEFNTGGVRWYRTVDGEQTQGFNFVPPATEASSFMKALSIGDIELLCDAAPVQIGNRVWIDTDRDGIQDAGETPVAGVTVRLYNASGTLVGTAITDAQGRYYFSSNVSEAAAGNGDSAGGGLTANASFTVKLDNNADFATGGPLVGYTMTNNDQTNAQSLLDDSIDSDAVKVSWKPEISVSPRLPGVNDHTFDVGFNTTTSPARLGNYVWYDENSDGLQTSGERPVSGVTLNLTDLSGNPVVDVSGNVVGPTTTDADGRYLFSNLHPGSYKVVITYPTGMQATTANAGSDTSVDSSTNTATSAMLAAGGEDLTLDFGIVPTNGWPAYNATTTTSSTSTSSTSSTVAPATSSTSTTVAGGSAGTTTTSPTTSSIPPATVVDGGVSVGNYVWIDLNKDGIQDAGEPGIAGVKLTLRDSTGRAVTDRAGKPVEPTYTDASGYYYFSNLPVGRYEVFITYPKGYTPTKTGSGTTANDSSTDSALSKDLPTPGMKDYTLDFGVIPSAVIEEPIWVDTNGDGFLSSGEKLVPSADVIILNEDGSPAKNLRGEPVTPVRTQDDGSFTFKDLAPGKYKVVVVYPEGYTAGLSSASSVMFTTDAVIPPSAAAMSSGKVVATPKSSTARKVTPVVSIGNLVWFDLDKDGFQDPAERGVSGATLTAFKADGKTRARDVNGRLVGRQKTSKNGRFLFTNLPPGGYVVKIVYPAGYRATIAKSAGRAKNSSTDVSKSLVLAAGESDMTLDFGLVRVPITRLPSTL